MGSDNGRSIGLCPSKFQLKLAALKIIKVCWAKTPSYRGKKDWECETWQNGHSRGIRASHHQDGAAADQSTLSGATPSCSIQDTRRLGCRLLQKAGLEICKLSAPA